jgi:LuxR family maltose regulon positive regulatory protein
MEAILQLNNSGATVPCFILLAQLKKSEGDMPSAFQIVNEGRNKLNEVNKTFWNYYFNVFTANLYLDLKDTASAAEWMDMNRLSIYDNLSISREFEYIVYARYLILREKYNDALLLLSRLTAFAKKENRLRSRIVLLCLMAVSYYQSNDKQNAITLLNQAIDLGMHQGYIRIFLDVLEPMEELLAEYLNGIDRVQDDKKYQYVTSLLQLVSENTKSFRIKNPLNRVQALNSEKLLSTRELKVLHLLVAGRSNTEIADELCITIRTVKYHNSQIYSKLGVSNRFSAINVAKEIGLLN